jgi:hypothetical protein
MYQKYIRYRSNPTLDTRDFSYVRLIPWRLCTKAYSLLEKVKVITFKPVYLFKILFKCNMAFIQLLHQHICDLYLDKFQYIHLHNRRKQEFLRVAGFRIGYTRLTHGHLYEVSRYVSVTTAASACEHLARMSTL